MERCSPEVSTNLKGDRTEQSVLSVGDKLVSNLLEVSKTEGKAPSKIWYSHR